MNVKTISMIVAAMAMSIGVSANAAIISGVSPSVTKANGDFIPGSGIPGGEFNVAQASHAALGGATTVEVALKAQPRFGAALVRSGNVYYAAPGPYSLAQPNLATWNFDFQFSPGENGAIADGFKVFLDVDFDPAVGSVSYATFGGTIPDPNFALLGYNMPNPGAGAWSSDNVDLVIAGSENLGFGYWGLFGKSFDPNAIGEYQINLRAQDGLGNPLAMSTIFVVTPEPTSIASLALSSLILRRRR